MDARFPTRYLTDRRVLKLSAEQFRTWTLATAYSVTNRTDGLIEKSDLPLIPFTTATEAAALVEAGLWKATGKGWLILEFESTQTSGAEMERLERRRKTEREKKAKQRAGTQQHVPGDVPASVPRDVPGDNTRDIDADVPGDRKGKASARKGSVPGNSETDLESFGYPTDQQAIVHRQRIDENSIRSVDELMEFAPELSRKQAGKIWAGAFPRREAG